MINPMKLAIITAVGTLVIAGITVGIVFATMGDDCIDLGPPEDLKFEQRDDRLFLVWKKPDNLGDCEARYKVVLVINENYKIVEVYTEEYEITSALPCAEINAAVSTLDVDDNESERVENKFTPDVGDVSQIEVKNLGAMTLETGFLISWEKPIRYISCNIVYKISRDGKVTDEAYDSIYLGLSNENLHICDNQIEVSPVIEGKLGKSAEIILRKDVGDVSTVTVTDLTYSLDGIWWILNWNSPINYQFCQIKYQLYIDIRHLLDTVEDLTIKMYNEALNKCTENDLSIVPVIQDKKGSPTYIQLTGFVNNVSYVTVGEITPTLKDNLWTINWEAPRSYEACSIIYQIYLNGNLQNEVLGLETTISNDLLKECEENNIGIKPIIEGKEGEMKLINIKGEPPIEDRITEISFEIDSLDNVKLEWKKSEEYEKCDFTYKLEIKKGEIVMRELEDLTKEIYEGTVWDIENCEEVSASVIARYNTDGKPMIFTQCTYVS